MKSVIVDSGSIITLSLNNLLWLFEKAKNRYNISFYLTDAVKREVVDNPLTTKRFKLEALQVMALINKGVLKVLESEKIDAKTADLLELANSSFRTKEQAMRLVHYPEMSAISASILYNADAVMIDERTTRYIIERPDKLRLLLNHKLHTKIMIDKKALNLLKSETKNVKFIRSAEFVTIAFEKGLLDEFLPNTENSKELLLDALLWGLKLNGCAIATKDLETLMRVELKYSR